MKSQYLSLAVALALTTPLIFTSFSTSAEISVIVHKDNASTFDKKSIRKLYMGKAKKFDNGRNALVINASKGSTQRNDFNKSVIGRSSSQINAYWSKLVFTGKGIPPKELSSDAEVLSTVTENKDTIGYVDSSAVTAAVKVVATF